MQNKKEEKQTIIIMGSLLFFILEYVALHMGYVYDEGDNPMVVIMNAMEHITAEPFIFMPFSVKTPIYMLSMAGIVIVFILWYHTYMLMHAHDKDASGNAHWYEDMKAYNKKYNTPFGKPKDTSGYDNMILAKDLYLSMDGRHTRRNSNQAVFGGSGAGKSYSLVKPNALQMNCSYVFTDPKGELLEELGKPLEENGYEIKIFNIKSSEMHKSMTYNPFHYIRDENGVRNVVKCIIDNTRGTDEKSGDPIWEDSMTALLQAVIFYMIEELPEEQRNLSAIMRILRLAQVDENNVQEKTPFDLLFDDLEKKKPNCMAVMSYKTFRIASGKTLKSILVTTMTRLDVFNMTAVANLTNTDTLHMEELGYKRQALFVITDAANDTYRFLQATLFTQLFEYLYHQVENVFPDTYFLQTDHDTYLMGKTKEEAKEKAKLIPESVIRYNDRNQRYEVFDKDGKILIESFTTEKAAKWFQEHAGGKVKRGKRCLPYHVRFILDEFANIGRIPGFVAKLSTMRSYLISCTIILQNLNQLKKEYGDDMGTIIGNCDTFIFLGSQEKDMIEYVEQMLGKTTKTQKSHSLSHGKQKGNNESYQFTAASLMAFNEIREMNDNDCVVFLKGEKPFFKKKYDLKDHPNYKQSGAANDDFKYKITLDNRRKTDIEEEEKEMEQEKEERYKKGSSGGGSRVLSMTADLSQVFYQICDGEPEKLQENLSMDVDEQEPVAETEEEKEESEEAFEEEEENMQEEYEKINQGDDDIWDQMDGLF